MEFPTTSRSPPEGLPPIKLQQHGSRSCPRPGPRARNKRMRLAESKVTQERRTAVAVEIHRRFHRARIPIRWRKSRKPPRQIPFRVERAPRMRSVPARFVRWPRLGTPPPFPSTQSDRTCPESVQSHACSPRTRPARSVLSALPNPRGSSSAPPPIDPPVINGDRMRQASLPRLTENRNVRPTRPLPSTRSRYSPAGSAMTARSTNPTGPPTGRSLPFLEHLHHNRVPRRGEHDASPSASANRIRIPGSRAPRARSQRRARDLLPPTPNRPHAT